MVDFMLERTESLREWNVESCSSIRSTVLFWVSPVHVSLIMVDAEKARVWALDLQFLPGLCPGPGALCVRRPDKWEHKLFPVRDCSCLLCGCPRFQGKARLCHTFEGAFLQLSRGLYAMTCSPILPHYFSQPQSPPTLIFFSAFLARTHTCTDFCLFYFIHLLLVF